MYAAMEDQCLIKQIYIYINVNVNIKLRSLQFCTNVIDFDNEQKCASAS